MEPSRREARSFAVPRKAVHCGTKTRRSALPHRRGCRSQRQAGCARLHTWDVGRCPHENQPRRPCSGPPGSGGVDGTPGPQNKLVYPSLASETSTVDSDATGAPALWPRSSGCPSLRSCPGPRHYRELSVWSGSQAPWSPPLLQLARVPPSPGPAPPVGKHSAPCLLLLGHPLLPGSPAFHTGDLSCPPPPGPCVLTPRGSRRAGLPR